MKLGAQSGLGWNPWDLATGCDLCDSATLEMPSGCGLRHPADVWGRDYVLEHFRGHTAQELAAVGLTWDEGGG
jgi:hypothetical protein